MLCHKKIEAREGNGEDKPVNFAWLVYIGMNKLGFSYREVGWLYFGAWADLFEQYKKTYNFEKSRSLYAIYEPEEISSLDAI